MDKLVSCVIPSYKRSDTLIRTINSVLAQTYKNIEVLVVDDNEIGDEYSRQVSDIVLSFASPRVKLVTQPKHINGAEARNAGIRAAEGEYIAFLDDDDEWLPNKIELQVEYLASHPECHGCSVYYDKYNKGTLVHSCPPYTSENLFQKIFRREVAVFTSTVLLNKHCLIESGMFDKSLKRHQDLQMLLRFTSNYKMGVLPHYLVKLHLDSDINRPSADEIVEIKRMFFTSIIDLYKGCDSKEKRLIKLAHCYEVFFVALKQKRVWMALRYFLKVGIFLDGYRLLYKRIKDRQYIANH